MILFFADSSVEGSLESHGPLMYRDPNKPSSLAEIDFLRGEKKVGRDCERMIRARVAAKIQRLRGELALLALDPKIRLVLEEARCERVLTNCRFFRFILYK
jgi:hypothetical protein